MPSLEEVGKRQVNTWRHVPWKARGLWATVFVRAMANVAFCNTEAAWTELQMLPKAVLAAPPLKAKVDNESARAAYTLDRLSRWEAGERMTLWEDMPPPPVHKPLSAEALDS